MSPRGKVTGTVTVDRVGGTVVLVVTDTRKARPRAASVYMSSAEARKLARTLTTHAKRGAR